MPVQSSIFEYWRFYTLLPCGIFWDRDWWLSEVLRQCAKEIYLAHLSPNPLTGCIYIAMWGISQVDVTYPLQPYPCSFVCLSFAKTVSSEFSSVHCISSESKSVIKLPKPCKHGNLPIKCEWNAVTHKRQAPYQFTQALNNGHWNKLRISQDLNVWIPLSCQMLPNLAWSLMLDPYSWSCASKKIKMMTMFETPPPPLPNLAWEFRRVDKNFRHCCTEKSNICKRDLLIGSPYWYL